MSILSRLKQSGINAEGGNRVYLPGDDFVTQMRKRTQKAVDDISPQVQSELVRPYKAESYGMHEYYQVPPPGIDWEPPIPEPIPIPTFRVATPVFSLSAGAYASGTKFTMYCLTSGATIYYTITLSGPADEPNENSNKYGGAPIPIIWDTMTIKAKAFKEGMEPSNIAVGTYVISSDEWSTEGSTAVAIANITAWDACFFGSQIALFGTDGATIKVYYGNILTGEWIEGADVGTCWQYWDVRCAINSTGALYVACSAETTMYPKVYTDVGGGGWVGTVIENKVVYAVDIFIDSSDYVHLCYFYNDGADISIRYATNKTGSWTAEEIYKVTDYWNMDLGKLPRITENGSAVAIVFEYVDNTAYSGSGDPADIVSNICCARGSAGSWTIDDVTELAFSSGDLNSGMTDIEVVDGNFIIIFAYTGDGGATYVHKQCIYTGTWGVTTIWDVSSGQHFYQSPTKICVTSGGKIVYGGSRYLWPVDNFNAEIRTNSSGLWKTDIATALTGNSPSSALCIDSNDVVHLFYASNIPSTSIYYKFK